jgi:hypothetical protein
MQQLCTIEQAARELGVPVTSLRSSAEKHGFIVRMGRAIRLDRNQLQELIKKCQGQPKGQGSTNSNTVQTGSSATQGNPTVQRAAQAAQRLKKPLAHTSQQKAAQVLPMNPKT